MALHGAGAVPVWCVHGVGTGRARFDTARPLGGRGAGTGRAQGWHGAGGLAHEPPNPSRRSLSDPPFPNPSFRPPLSQVKTRRSPHQVEVAEQNKQRRFTAYKGAHKAATREYADAVQRGELGSKGKTAQEIAARHDAELSPDNPGRVGANALRIWSAQGKGPGRSPLPRGPNGLQSDPIEKRPFMWAFREDRVRRAWDAVGAVSNEGWVTYRSDIRL